MTIVAEAVERRGGSAPAPRAVPAPRRAALLGRPVDPLPDRDPDAARGTVPEGVVPAIASAVVADATAVAAPDAVPDGASAAHPADATAEFTAFVREAGPALGRLALFLTGDVHRAEELVQQTLVRTFEAWPRARDGDPLVYARRILANQRIDTWRRRRRELLVDPTTLPERGVPDGARERAERDQLVRALATLGTKRRRVVVLRYLVGLSERDVADELGLPVGTVKSSAARGLAELRALLDDAHEPPPVPGTAPSARQDAADGR